MPTCIPELGVGKVSDADLRELADNATVGGSLVLSHIRKLGMEDVYNIYCLANK